MSKAGPQPQSREEKLSFKMVVLVKKAEVRFCHANDRSLRPNQHMKSFVPGLSASSDFAEPRY